MDCFLVRKGGTENTAVPNLMHQLQVLSAPKKDTCRRAAKATLSPNTYGEVQFFNIFRHLRNYCWLLCCIGNAMHTVHSFGCWQILAP